MRVIAGEFRSRRLKTVSGTLVRPTPDRLREALFNVLASHIPGKVFVDAYAGSGAVGIEAFSRGARQVVLIEKSPAALTVIRQNLALLGVREGISVAAGAAHVLLPKCDCDIGFVDPPYHRTNEYELAMNALAGTACQLAIAQHDSKFVMPANYGTLHKVRLLRQGDNSLTFFQREEKP